MPEWTRNYYVQVGFYLAFFVIVVAIVPMQHLLFGTADFMITFFAFAVLVKVIPLLYTAI